MKCNRTYRDSYRQPEREWGKRPDYDDGRYPEHDREDYCPPMPPMVWPKPQPRYESASILKCGTASGSAPIPTNFVGLTGVNGASVIPNGNYCNSAVQSTLALDTSELIDATVKFDFSSLITYRTVDLANYFLRLVFKLKKVCEGASITLGSWVFERSQNFPGPPPIPTDAFQQVTEPFSYSWCSCADCGDCCTYVVEVEQEAYNIGFVAITNISASALAVGLRLVD